MKAYAIKYPNGKIDLSSVKEFEDECKDNFIDTRNVSIEWEDLHSAGFECVPVEITEIKK